tara:strand:+ start:159 stop:269 length:111 start_codon:yes stop_codon:yes gene_type:complete
MMIPGQNGQMQEQIDFSKTQKSSVKLVGDRHSNKHY